MMGMDSQTDQADRVVPAARDTEAGEEGIEFGARTDMGQGGKDASCHTKVSRGGGMILFCIAAVIVLAFGAIAVGLVINDDGGGIDLRELLIEWMEELSQGREKGANWYMNSFPTERSEIVKGEMCAVGEDGFLYLPTEYGVCRVEKNKNGYEYNGWALEFGTDMKVSSMAVYGDYLYLACGKHGLYRVNVARGKEIAKIIDENVASFLIVEDNLVYSIRQTDGLHSAGLDGEGSRLLGWRQECLNGFVYMDGYFYCLDYGNHIRRMRADGMVGRVLVEPDQAGIPYTHGLYQNSGTLYLTANFAEGIYGYDVRADEFKIIADACVSADDPILFAGDALLYRERESREWHQIIRGKDTVFASPLNDADLSMQVIGDEELLVLHEKKGYYVISFSDGKIRSEAPIVMADDTIPGMKDQDENSGSDDPAFTEEAQTEQTACHASYLVYDGQTGSEYSAQGLFHYVIVRRDLYENADYFAFGYGESAGLAISYTDENGTHTEPLVDGDVRCFLVMENQVSDSEEPAQLIFTMRDTDTGQISLYRKKLSGGAEAELMVAEGMSAEFACYHNNIYYVNMKEGKTLYCYDPESGENHRVNAVETGCFDIWNDTVYYENISDRTLCKMHLDGSGTEQINMPYEGAVYLYQLKLCPYRGSIYLACTTGMGNSLLLFSEDGSLECWVVTELGSEINQRFFYRDGELYYSTGNIRVFDFDRYFEGGFGDVPNQYDGIFYAGNIHTFAVTDETVYVRAYEQPGMILALERRTGMLMKEIDG